MDKKELKEIAEDICAKLKEKYPDRDKKYISDEAILSYLDRLSTTYGKENKKFYKQFKEGSGSELKYKFWSPRSSSRLCFDLYSCFANYPQVLDIEFEYNKLPGICSGRDESPANMDVYIKTEDCIFFIESKFTETTNNENYKKKDGLPQAYWVTEDTYLSSEGNLVTKSIADRITFKGNKTEEQILLLERMRIKFPEFCKDVISYIDNNVVSQRDWFDAKQETCHIFGILLYSVPFF